MTNSVPVPKSVYLKPSEIYFTDQPTIVSTVLGSCVSVTMYSRENRTGSICHAVLPEETSSCGEYRFVDTSILAMLRRFSRLGVPRDQIEVKLFGGAEILLPGAPGRQSSVGNRNIETALSCIEREQLRLIAADTGGSQGRKLLFHTHTGDVYLQRLNGLKRY